MSIVNISAYRFVSLDDLPMLRERIRGRCMALDLKGTILLAPEGINLFLAGSRERIDAFVGWLHEDPRFAAIVPKESLSGAVPFRRLRVRLKQEIITMRQPAIRPASGRAPSLDAATLRRWLAQGHDDAGRELVMLDTRNGYETALGAFADAVDYRLASFTGFPAAVAADRDRYDGKTVVSYCTGGIRCEKAALHMRDLGMSHVYQLEGGILNYLELTDGSYWRGDCFVFDERGAVDKRLRARPAAPGGEQAGVKECAGDGVEPGHPPRAQPACARPSSRPAPQGRAAAHATSAELDRSGA
ncbi:MAG: sulfurtransferase [Xanthomonadaceae bacterium]|nr:sulfurtransferase [Xanthomonadaceae bacterium]MDE3072620.1 sulfurtransferase [Pseudomonadota bacterium]